MNILELAILKKMVGGGGGSGTDNYNDLSNLPQINGETLAGNKTAENLGLQDALTFDSTPTEDSTNPVESGGVFNALAGKQDNLTFDGTYDASTNKAATESTVTDAINELDVSETSFDADETIDTISETDGKIAVTKKDIAIASNQVTSMTGYTKPSSAPATPAIQTNDTANQAFGKLEFKADTNQTNIWYTLNKVGKNLFNFKEWSEAVPVNKGTKTVSDNAITLTATDNDCFTKYGSEFPIGAKIAVTSGETITLSWNYAQVQGHSQTDDQVFIFTYDSSGTGAGYVSEIASVGKKDITIPNNAVTLDFRVGVSVAGDSATYSNIMICHKSVYDQDSSFQPYGAPNYDLTYREQQDRNALVEVIDNGAKNLFDNANGEGTSHGTSVTTWDSATGTATQVLTDTKTNLSLKLGGRSGSSGTWTGIFVNMDVTSNGVVSIPFTAPINTTELQFGHNGSTADALVVLKNCVLKAGKKYYIQCNVINCVQASGAYSWKDIMVCDAPLFDISPAYEPHALPNTDLTQLESEDRAALAEVVDSGAKNKFNVSVATAVNGTISNGTFVQDTVGTKTNLEFKFIALSNGNWVNLLEPRAAITITQNGVRSIEFICPPNVTQLRFGHNGSPNDSVEVIKTSSLISGQAYVLQLNILNCVQASGAYSWKDVMICTEADWKVSQKYAPYRKNLDQLEATKAPVLSGSVDSGSINDVTTNMFAMYTSNVTDLPTSANYYVETSVFDANSLLQRAYNIATAESYVRVKCVGTWSAWKQITNA